MNNRYLGLIAALIATSIFGFNHTIAKELMPEFISPTALLYVRVLGAAILFWIISLFFPNEVIKKEDRIRLVLCAMFGMSINMITSLLIIILEKSKFIGILKAIGATNWNIRRIFLYNSLYIVLNGLLWGNLFAIGFSLLQRKFNIISI